MMLHDPGRLVRLIYRSRDTGGLGGRDGRSPALRDLVADAARRNAERGLGGALLWIDGEFIQVLEGPLEAVEHIFEAICRDRRHRDLRLVDFAPASERCFAGWSMVLADGSGEGAASAEPIREALAGEQRSAVVIEAIRAHLGRTAACKTARPARPRIEAAGDLRGAGPRPPP